MIYVLFVMVSMNGKALAVHSQEFSSKERCEQAVVALDKQWSIDKALSGRKAYGVCVPR
ncbi:MAG: hypothetical protein ACK5QX_07970 [bacterium]